MNRSCWREDIKFPISLFNAPIFINLLIVSLSIILFLHANAVSTVSPNASSVPIPRMFFELAFINTARSLHPSNAMRRSPFDLPDILPVPINFLLSKSESFSFFDLRMLSNFFNGQNTEFFPFVHDLLASERWSGQHLQGKLQ